MMVRMVSQWRGELAGVSKGRYASEMESSLRRVAGVHASFPVLTGISPVPQKKKHFEKNENIDIREICEGERKSMQIRQFR